MQPRAYLRAHVQHSSVASWYPRAVEKQFDFREKIVRLDLLSFYDAKGQEIK